METAPFNSDEGFESDDEVLAIARAVRKSEEGISVMVSDKAKQVLAVFKIMREIVKGKDVSVTYELNTPYASMGAVTIKGREVTITNPALFARVAEMASDFEVYPLAANRAVQMDFTFHGLTRKAGKK